MRPDIFLAIALIIPPAMRSVCKLLVLLLWRAVYTKDMYISILGRQSALGLAELERVCGNAKRFSDHCATTSNEPHVTRLGGSLKTGKVIRTLPYGNWSDIHRSIINHYTSAWRTSDHKIALGISAYDLRVSPRDIQKTGIALKKALKAHDVSLRLLPNKESSLNTATSHHNKLGLSANKVELLIIKGRDGTVIIAESTGAQNITALAARDQGRPKRDAFVGMLPPKLAQLIVNLAVGRPDNTTPRVLDPFCGTGVVLQEGALLGYEMVGSDLSTKMIDFSQVNLDWLQRTHHVDGSVINISEGDATTYSWASSQPITAVACETYLGQPFSAPPSPSKLREVRGNCNHIIGNFMRNISQQLESGTTLCLAVPAWRHTDGSFTHLPLVSRPEEYGFDPIRLKSVRSTELLYYREDQVVARELILLQKK